MNLSYRGQEFVGQVRPMLERCEPEELIDHLSRFWAPRQLVGLLRCGDPDVPRTALVCLALTGTMAESTPIAGMLHDENERTAEFAEQALWSIWFRASDEQANRTLSLAVGMIAHGDCSSAIEWLSIVALRRPEFAEVFNQRASARFLVGHYQQAIRDTRAALRLNPLHFGAMATQGHCHAAMGQPDRAVEMYHAGLQINPKMDSIREALQQVWAYAQQRK